MKMHSTIESAATPASGPMILDCSLRDGGYQNNWDFSLALVRSHLELLTLAGIQMAEIGLRSPSLVTDEFLGLCGHTSGSLLADLQSEFSQISLGVMVNQADFEDNNHLLRRFEGAQSLNALSFVRVATNLHTFPEALRTADLLTEMGFSSYVNVMQIAGIPANSLTQLFSKYEFNGLAGLYLADSLGAMSPQTTKRLVSSLVEVSPIPIGVHFHDNFSLAFANSIEAVGSGASLVDGTVLGIGRGAGNSRLELLALEYLPELQAREMGSVVGLWENWASQNRDLAPWGPSFEYALAAKRNVHPTYVQKMGQDESYSIVERVKVIEMLGAKGSSKYSESELEVGREWFDAEGAQPTPVENLFAGGKILLLGGGQILSSFREEVVRIADLLELVVCVVGAHDPGIPAEYRIISHPLTILSHPEVLLTEQTLIGPLNQFKDLAEVPAGISLDLELSSQRFGFDGSKVHSPSTRSSIYALALLAGMNCESILVAGFDGFGPGDSRNREFEDAVAKLSEFGVSPLSLTPTGLNLQFRAFD